MSKERLNIFADAHLVEAVEAERERLAREQGVRVSISAAAAALIRRGVERTEDQVTGARG